MKKANFRMVLFGIESANQSTLDRINKGVKADDIISTLKRASESGIEPHIAVMFGYPWESEKEELQTLDLVHYLLRKGYASTAQASVYDVKGISKNDRYKLVNRIYDASLHMDFWWNQLRSIRNISDLSYLIKKIKKGIMRD
jgi:radical SAM superfamily enzyme YgiQ (UPF0313 family)